MTIENGKVYSWKDIKVSIGGVESPGLVNVKAIQAIAAQVVEDNTRDLIGSPVPPLPLTEVETLDIQERVRQSLMSALVPGFDPAADPDPFTSREAPTRPDLTSLPYARPSDLYVNDTDYGRALLEDHDGYPTRTLRAWRKPEQRRPRSTSMVGTGPVFVGELDIRITSITVSPGAFYFGSTTIEVHGTMPERDTGKRETFVFAQSVHSAGEKPMREVIREALVTFMAHEIDEQIYEVQADGTETRPFDPHGPVHYSFKVNP